MSVNPYQSPPILDEGGDAQSEFAGENCWRDDDQLVVSDDSQLPGNCLFCNRWTSQLVRQSLIAYPPTRFIALTLLGGCIGLIGMLIAFSSPKFSFAVIGLAVVALIVWALKSQSRHPKLQKRFPICGWHRIQRKLPVLTWTLISLFVGLNWLNIFPGKVFDEYYTFLPMIVIFVASMPAKPIKAVKHKAGRFWIQGCGKAFLQRLPELDKKTWPNVGEDTVP